MKTYFKMNIFLKILTVAILGYYSFEIFFSILTGSFGADGNSVGGNPHHGSAGTSSIYSYDAIINLLLLLLVRLLIVIFLLVLIMGVSKLMKVLWNSEENKNSKSYLNSKDANTLLMVVGSFIGITILYSIFKGFYIVPNDYGVIGNNSMHFYNNPAVSMNNYLGIFFSALLYITAIILGFEIFSYFTTKQKR